MHFILPERGSRLDEARVWSNELETLHSDGLGLLSTIVPCLSQEHVRKVDTRATDVLTTPCVGLFSMRRYLSEHRRLPGALVRHLYTIDS